MLKIFCFFIFISCSILVLADSNNTVKNESSKIVYQNQVVKISEIIGQTGSSRILNVSYRYPNIDHNFLMKVLVNCKTKEIYNLGYVSNSESTDYAVPGQFLADNELSISNRTLPHYCKRNYAQNRMYIPLGVTSKANEFYIFLSDTLKTNDDVSSFWLERRKFKKDFLKNDDGTILRIQDTHKPIEISVEDEDSEYSIIKYSINCKNKVQKINQIFVYDPKGNVKNSFTYEQDKFEEPVPGSVTEGFIEIVCKII